MSHLAHIDAMSFDPNVVSENELETIKQKFRASFQFDLCQRRGECISCSAKTMLWSSERGKAEYGMSGVCEECFDTVTSVDIKSAQKCRRCNKLTTLGVEFLQIWIVVRKASRILRMLDIAEKNSLIGFGTSDDDARRLFLRGEFLAT